MKKKKLFIVKNLIVSVLGLILAYLMKPFVHASNSYYLFLVPIFAFSINYASFLAATGAKAKNKLNIMLYALFGIKFFSYLILVLVFFILEHESIVRIHFILFLFLVYASHTILLLTNTLKYFKD